MKNDELQTLWTYNAWANQRILAAAQRVTPGQYIQPAQCSFGSLRGTLVHIFSAETVWRQRCADGNSPQQLPSEAGYASFDDLRVAWETDMGLMRSYIERLDLSSSDAPIRYRNTKGLEYVTPLWQIIVHVVNHGTQFRSEAGMLLSSWGFSPGDLDLILYLREK